MECSSTILAFRMFLINIFTHHFIRNHRKQYQAFCTVSGDKQMHSFADIQYSVAMRHICCLSGERFVFGLDFVTSPSVYIAYPVFVFMNLVVILCFISSFCWIAHLLTQPTKQLVSWDLSPTLGTNRPNFKWCALKYSITYWILRYLHNDFVTCWRSSVKYSGTRCRLFPSKAMKTLNAISGIEYFLPLTYVYAPYLVKKNIESNYNTNVENENKSKS